MVEKLDTIARVLIRLVVDRYFHLCSFSTKVCTGLERQVPQQVSVMPHPRPGRKSEADARTVRKLHLDPIHHSPSVDEKPEEAAIVLDLQLPVPLTQTEWNDFCVKRALSNAH